MVELFAGLSTAAIYAFAIASMLSLGLGHSPREIAAPLRDVRTVLRVLVPNFVVVPFVAVAVSWYLSLERSLEVGLILSGMAAGAPFLVKLTEHAEHDVGLSATLLLLPATVLFMTVFVPVAVPDAVAVDAAAVARPLTLTMLLPMAAGFLVRARSPRWAASVRPALAKLSTLALVLLVATTVIRNLRAIVDVFGTGAILAATLVVALAFLAGYAFGGPSDESRGVLGLATAQRNIAAATVVASESFHDPRTLVMVVISSLVALGVLFPAANVLRRRARGEAGTWSPRRRPA
jgi:BASS family bile acid:Na+ symporter